MEFSLPEDIGGLSNEELSDLVEQALTEFNTLNESDSIEDETLEAMELLANVIEALQVEKSSRVQLAAKAALAAKVETASATTETEEVETEVEAEEVVEAADDEVVEAEVEEEELVEAASEEAETVVDTPEIVTPSTPAKESIVASTTSVSVPEKPKMNVIIAAAQDVPQFYVGQRLDNVLLADAVHNKARMLSDSRGAQTVYPVATLERPFGEGYDLEGLDQAASWDRIAELSKPSALTAAGGWCAPSQIVYDLFEVECENDILFQLPTFRVTRGGIRWPVFVPHDEAFNPGFVWTEADDIAATSGSPTKPCVRISCPTFTECRLDAVGLCITAGNLIDRAYPEQVRWFINRAMRAYERNNAARKLNLVLADTVPVVIPATFGAASALVSALLLLASDYRQVNGLCCGENLDLILPCWVTDLIKADVARQDATLSMGSLPTDAEVAAWFEAAGLNLRYISHWQYYAVHPALAWPATVQALIMYPGSYVEFNQGRLDLGVIRDSVLNATNDYTAVWFEEFYCVGRRGPQGYLATVPVCPLGETGGRNPSSGEVVCPAP